MDTLSIVFQGPVVEGGGPPHPALFFIQRTRQCFPHAEMIVSTWYRTPEADAALLAQLSVMDVRLVLSEDPGALTGSDGAGTWLTNLNRLRVSAQAGLAAATRPLAVKLRTDCYLGSRALVGLLNRHVVADDGLARDGHFQVFSRRVINASLFARDARGSLPYLFHPGDILLAGRTADVRLFFSAPPATPALFAPATMPGLWCAWRYVPEQYFWVHAIHQATDRWVYDGNFHYTPAQVAASEQYYLANFRVTTPSQLGLRWPKYWRRYPLRGLFSVYTPSRWQRLYLRNQGSVPRLSVLARMEELMTGVWRTGYRLRTRILRCPPLRRLLVGLLGRRS
ncbi:hypothetical protein FH968_00145 [Buttiauxella sp. B2]|uniref:WavE lipopolysaccharide synthesis family protein n=1 Tax=Buttiauxella sp. B2 TaxID=2587812 RepID=UPI00111F311B|nr:WavE lipopolysaccharide synthesis family protein [Buttiauxella sp. B2]TNV22510.1 hypothetical protein FH968_00145 [Buttiauxella sp. B2]